ncbi:MAG TPA: glucosamine-6-phosphate deaminase [Chthoniobacteraceae bacterium]|nr:glucosamine-6-phosphate deaminase [Chthoniobacteraceae bacterium]
MTTTAQKFGQLEVRVFPNRSAMGAAAAQFAAGAIAEACAARGEARVIFASAPSQSDFLDALTSPQNRDAIDWRKVTAFHMDEYAGFPASRPESFRHFLRNHLLERLPAPPAFHEIRGEAADPDEECARYTALLAEKPIDLVCLGIGENGHLAFNDPPVADFHDPHTIKLVELDESCRRQQVNDGCFPTIDAVPQQALTLTIPALFSAKHVCAIVPGARKAGAVRAALLGPIDTSCPASILRTHPHAVMHLDPDSAPLLKS